MPLYEYRCRTCDETFELRRPMSDSSAPAECTSGHLDSVRLLSVFASVGASTAGSTGGSSSSAPAPAARGGVCGSSCGCHH